MSYVQKSVLNKQLPAYLGVFVLLIALGITILLSGNTLVFISKATVGSNPKNIQISNLSDSSFTISYVTDAAAAGSISYGNDPSTPEVALDDRDQQASGSADHQIHFITVKNLAPSTKYYYVIDSGSQKAENNSAPFEITTAPPAINQPSTQPTLSGSVSLSDNSIPTEGIVYITTDNMQQMATLINPDGSYQLSLDQLRSSSGVIATTLTPNTILQLQAVTSTQTSTAKVLLSQADQVPKIILPQNYDFTLGPSQPSTEPSQTASGAGFPILATPQPVSSPEITSPTEAQNFKDQQPLFQGRALANTEVDVTIQSQQEISTKLQSDDSGSWQFRPPLALAPGKHTITIKSLNAAGILQTISRSFTVYAQGSQFVEPSVSPIASPTRIATPTAVLVPTATTAPTATPTPTAAITPTSHPTTPGPNRGPIPKTGSSAIVTGMVAGISILGIGALLIFLSIV